MTASELSEIVKQMCATKFNPRYVLMPIGQHKKFLECGYAEVEIDGHMWIDLGELQNCAGE